MKTLARLGSLVMVSVLAGHSVLAQGAAPYQQESYGKLPALSAAAASGKIKPANVENYYVGYDLMYARYLVVLGDAVDAVEHLKLLSKALSGQDEAQIQSCLRMILNGEGTVEQIDGMLKKVQLRLEGKLSGDTRWFYDVGKAYAQFFIAIEYLRESSHAEPFRQALINLGQLAKRAPSDVPNQVVSSLARLGKIGEKSRFDVDDVAAIKSSVTAIDAAMVV